MTQDIELALQLGKLKGAKQLLKEYYEAQDKAEYEAQLRSEYESLYPMFEYETEILDTPTKYNPYNMPTREDGFMLVNENLDSDGFVVSYEWQRKLEPPITFDEYKNETRVIQEASYVCDECQLALDSETCTNNTEHTTRLIPEVTELVRPYIPKDTTERVDNYIKSKYAELRRKEYPPIEEFADAWVKNDTDGMELYRSKCLAVKEKYPKG